MKSALTLMMCLITGSAFSMSLSFKDHVELKKTTITRSLPVEYLKLYRNFNFEGERMIAGKFDTQTQKKKTYLDGLRTKLDGYKGSFRF